MGNESGSPNSTPKSAGGSWKAQDSGSGRYGEDVERALEQFRETVQQPAPPIEPVPEGDAELRRMAERVRSWREEGGLTLQELARRSGVAASTIQKVETRQMIPTVGVLIKIAHGLDRSTTELFREPTEELDVVHLPVEARHPVGMRDRMVVERLTGDLVEPRLEVWRVIHQPGTGSGSDPIRWDGEALVFCEAGEMEFRIGEEDYALRAGDSLHYKTTIPHLWANRGTEPARLMIVVTMPEKLRTLFHRHIRRRPQPGATAKRPGATA
jgi:transcriptional regulator with XRE-family HTH domain